MTAAPMRADARPACGEHAPRLAFIDAVRGGALLAMFGYHLAWDLAFFGLISEGIPLGTTFKAYAHAVAAAFLLLVGVGLALADRGGMRWRAYRRRLAAITAAAAAVTLVTWRLFPDRFIFFGILHCIALASVLALPFRRAPLAVVALAAAACIALPWLVASPMFDAPPLWWLGLGTQAPATYDYRPVFPWLGVVLAGILLARLGAAAIAALDGWVPVSRPGRLLAWGGRHSLAVYLLHQPVFLGALFLAAQAFGRPAEPGASFLRACAERCAGQNAAVQTCTAACGCLADRLKAANLWADAAANRLTDDEGERVRGLALACSRGEPH